MFGKQAIYEYEKGIRNKEWSMGVYEKILSTTQEFTSSYQYFLVYAYLQYTVGTHVVQYEGNVLNWREMNLWPTIWFLG